MTIFGCYLLPTTDMFTCTNVHVNMYIIHAYNTCLHVHSTYLHENLYSAVQCLSQKML